VPSSFAEEGKNDLLGLGINYKFAFERMAFLFTGIERALPTFGTLNPGFGDSDDDPRSLYQNHALNAVYQVNGSVEFAPLVASTQWTIRQTVDPLIPQLVPM